MDAYLTEEARAFLQAQTSAKRKVGGVLLGHLRGRRFIVESLYPCPEADFLTEAGFWNLQKIFDGRIIGFYSSRSLTGDNSPLFKPFACGKLFLSLALRSRNRLAVKARIIEFEGRYFLSPIPLSRPPKE